MTKSQILEMLRENFPWGHKDFNPTMLDLMELHSVKNHDYARGGDPLGNFKRVSKILKLYPGLRLDEPETIAFLYSLKQIDAVLWALSQGGANKAEGLASRLSDISVYAVLVRILLNDPESVYNIRGESDDD